MLEIKNITKKFGDKTALENLSFTVPEGSVFGLIGSNGSGKSTLLRIISGVFKPDGGSAEIDGISTYENPDMKEKCFFISDYPYFYNNSTLDSMAAFYKEFYPTWDEAKFEMKYSTDSIPLYVSLSRNLSWSLFPIIKRL